MNSVMLVKVLGIVLLLVGVLGFFMNPILGIFEVDTLHNIIHIATGLLALFFAMKGSMGAKQFAKIFGIVYAVVALAGLFMGGDMILGLFAANMADHVLHVLLALVFLWIGFSNNE